MGCATASLGRKNKTLSPAHTTHRVVDGGNGRDPMGAGGRSHLDAGRTHLASRRGMVGGDHCNECVVRKARGALVWVAREGGTLAGFGPHPTHARSDAASCSVGAFQFCGLLFPPNVERPNLHVVTAFLSHRMAVVGAAWILLWVTVALVGSPLRPDPSPMANAQHLDQGMLSPGSTWLDDAGTTQTAWLGTDRYGRDLLSRLMAGSGISLSVGAGAVLISLLLGLLLGGMAGYLGGRVDAVLSWFLQVMWSIPTLLMVLAITLAFGKGFWQVFLAIGLTMWVEVARIVRGQFLGLREQAYVQAAEALDLPALRVMVRHMLPNAVGPLVVVCAANFSAAILIEAGLSFLGVGAQIPMPSWGNIVKEHAHLLTTDHAWIALIPGALIASLVLAFTWVGDGFRMAFAQRG